MVGLVYGPQHHFQQYFSYIMAVSFISGGSRSTRRKPLTGFELTILVVKGTDCTGSCKSNYHMIITRQPPLLTEDNKYFAGNI
jgi:hypothetical protein